MPGQMNVVLESQPISMYSAQNPLIKGVYVWSGANFAGVVAANNFATLFNPVGSGKLISFGGAFVSMVTGAAASATAPMRGLRITAHSGGSLAGAASYGKFDSNYPTSIAEVRTGNPTITAGSFLWNTPPAVTTGAGGGQFIHTVNVPPGVGPFTLREGEGVAVQTSVGDTDQVWNISFAWAEI